MNSYADRSTLFLVILLLAAGLLTAQDSTRTTRIDQGTQMLVEQGNLNQQLIFGGGFTVTNAAIGYDIDDNKLYLDPELRPHVITLVGGLTDTLMARVQLLDQVLEVVYDDEELQIDNQSLQSVTSDDGRHFVASRRPLVINEPPPLLELLATHGTQRLYAYRRVEFKEPAQQKSAYATRDDKRRLSREDILYLISPLDTEKVTKLKQLIELLPRDQQPSARTYAKQERLRNREEDFVQLLNFLD